MAEAPAAPLGADACLQFPVSPRWVGIEAGYLPFRNRKGFAPDDQRLPQGRTRGKLLYLKGGFHA